MVSRFFMACHYLGSLESSKPHQNSTRHGKVRTLVRPADLKALGGAPGVFLAS